MRQGSLQATFAYDLLTDCLRRTYGNFRSQIRILGIWLGYGNKQIENNMHNNTMA